LVQDDRFVVMHYEYIVVPNIQRQLASIKLRRNAFPNEGIVGHIIKGGYTASL
jgi:hypothetical protein